MCIIESDGKTGVHGEDCPIPFGSVFFVTVNKAARSNQYTWWVRTRTRSAQQVLCDPGRGLLRVHTWVSTLGVVGQTFAAIRVLTSCPLVLFDIFSTTILAGDYYLSPTCTLTWVSSVGFLLCSSSSFIFVSVGFVLRRFFFIAEQSGGHFFSFIDVYTTLLRSPASCVTQNYCRGCFETSNRFETHAGSRGNPPIDKRRGKHLWEKNIFL